MSSPRTVEELREAQAAEYGTYVAVQEILIDGARAFNAGDAVPKSHVDGGVVPANAVAKNTTKAGQQAVAAATEPSKG